MSKQSDDAENWRMLRVRLGLAPDATWHGVATELARLGAGFHVTDEPALAEALREIVFLADGEQGGECPLNIYQAMVCELHRLYSAAGEPLPPQLAGPFTWLV